MCICKEDICIYTSHFSEYMETSDTKSEIIKERKERNRGNPEEIRNEL